MSKRPRTKGRGVDVYLGGHSEAPSNSQRVASASATAKQLNDAGNEKIFEPLAKLGESVCGLHCAKKVAVSFIEASEKLANQAIALHQESMSWVKETALAPWFDAQISMARQVVECSASAARNLWRIIP